MLAAPPASRRTLIRYNGRDPTHLPYGRIVLTLREQRGPPLRARIRRNLVPAGLILLITLTLTNVWMNIERLRQPPHGVPKEMTKVWEAYAEIQKRYVKPIDPNKLADGAVKGMVDSLNDPFASYFITGDYTTKVEKGLGGRFEGIGATVNATASGSFAISSLVPGSPAEKAGLVPGDVILKVGDTAVDGLSVAEIVGLIRGPRDTPVTLTIQAAATAKVSALTLTRAAVQFPTVSVTMLGYGIAQVRIASFVPQTSGELDQALKQLQDQQVKAIVLDVRNNLGGLLTVAVDTASQFIDRGLVVSQMDSAGKRTDLDARGDGRFTTVPMVVLVNRFSASGSEVVAGALQARGRAVLVGTHTYGKGVVNQPVKLADGSGLYIPIATWYTPSGKAIDRNGLTPDIPADRTLEDVHAGRDPQLDRAVEVLRSALGKD